MKSDVSDETTSSTSGLSKTKTKKLDQKTRTAIGYIFMLICYLIAILLAPAKGSYYGFWSALPVISIFVFILMTKHILEGFLWSGMLAVIIEYHWVFFTQYIEETFNSVCDPDNFYTVLLFLMIGVIVIILKKSGASTYFARWISKKAKSSRTMLLITYLVGVALCVDDYTSALAGGAALSPVNDQYGIPREMTAYAIRSSVTTPACLAPIGSWVIWTSALLVKNGLAADGQGIAVYMTKLLPYLFFPFTVYIVGLLVIFGVIPKFGKMKRAYERVAAGGPPAPIVDKSTYGDEEEEVEKPTEPRKNVNLVHFFLPIAALFIFGLIFSWNMIYALFAAILATFVYYIITKVFTVYDATNCVFEGFSYMTQLAIMMVFGLTLCRICGELGFTEYVVSLTQNFVTPALLPFIVYILFCATEFLVTFNWTLYLIAMPIVVALATSVGANVFLCVGALVSSGVFGYCLAFSSDGGMCACGACGIDIYEQNTTQMPYMLISMAAAGVAYLLCGII